MPKKEWGGSVRGKIGAGKLGYVFSPITAAADVQLMCTHSTVSLRMIPSTDITI